MNDATFYIQHLQLVPHPEGGFYKETYRSAGVIPGGAVDTMGNSRPFSTAIYYLLRQGDFSAFHRIKSDECWHYYSGDSLLIHVLHNNGRYECVQLGTGSGETFQFVVPANTWFAAACPAQSRFVLAGCTVAPGFDFADFEMADASRLVSEFPEHSSLILRFSR